MSGDVSLQEEPVIFYSEEMTMAKMNVLKAYVRQAKKDLKKINKIKVKL